MKRTLLLAILTSLTSLSALCVAEPGIVIKASELRSAPMLDASVSGKLAEKSRVDILSSKGGWMEVKTAEGKSGWVRLMNVEPVEGKGGSSGKGLAAFGNVARTGSTSTTAATGVKGISKEDLAGAKANFDEVAKLDRYRASTADGQQHARTAGLKAQSVEALPANTQ